MSASPARSEWALGSAPLVLGCMALTGIYGRVDRSVALRTIHHAISLGFDHFDTAALYGPFSNEEILADALAGHSQATVATKVGYRLEGGEIVGIDCRPESIRSAVEGSLRRLRRDRIDLVYQHRQDPHVPVEDVVGALAELVDGGKIRFVGLSRVDAATLARGRSVHAITAVQNELSLLTNDPDHEVIACALDGDSAFLAYSPLARGLLVDCPSRPGPDDYRSGDARFTPDNAGHVRRATTPLRRIASERGTSSTAIALAWVRECGARPVVGPKTPKQLDEALASIEIRLSEAEVKDLSRISVL